MIQYNINLQPYNTFGISATASSFVAIEQLADLQQLTIKTTDDYFILGGGSNVLFTQNPKGLVIKNNLKGIDVVKETEEHVYVKVAAGENWHQFVLFTVNHGWGGLENLSLIPGNAGASPMQNIGAYGVEIKDCFEALEAFYIDTHETNVFRAEDCHFGYRESVFKHELKNQYIITSVTYRLDKNPKINSSYGAIAGELEKFGITNPTIKDISDAVIRIRSSKLPDPKEIGSAGSFFKNPIVSSDFYAKLQQVHSEIPCYKIDEATVKIPAGWLIDHDGWKGKTFGNYGVHKLQALVLVNYGGATGQQVYDLSEKIIASVKAHYGVTLEREVNII